MQNNQSLKSKLLQKTVLGIAIYLIAFFVLTLLFTSFFAKTAYYSLLPTTLAQFIAAVISFFFLGTDERSEVLFDNEAYFSNKPFFILYTVLLSFSFTVAFNYLFSLIPWDTLNISNVSQNNDFFFSFPIYVQIIAYVFMIPIAEETLFRILIFFKLKKIISYPAAALLTGILFGIYHGNLMQGLYAFIMGTVICLVMQCGGSILYALLFHMIANLISILCQTYPAINDTVYSPLTIIAAYIYIVFTIILGLTLKNRLTKKDK